MLENKDFCDYDTCVTLRELGFTLDMTEKVYERNLMTNRYETIPKPLLYEAQKWLRKEKSIEANASFDKEDDGWIAFIQRLDYPDLCGTDILSTVYNTYEEALSEGIKKAIELK